MGIYRAAVWGGSLFAVITIITAILHICAVRWGVMDVILAVPELLTFLWFGDDDDFLKHMHTVAMPFGVSPVPYSARSEKSTPSVV